MMNNNEELQLQVTSQAYGDNIMAKLWTEVIANPEFQQLSANEKNQAKQAYFEEVIAPQVPSDQVGEAYTAFNNDFPDYTSGISGAIGASVDRLKAGAHQLMGDDEAAQESLREAQRYQPTVSSYKDAFDSPSNFGSYVGENLAQGLVYAPAMIGGPVGLVAAGGLAALEAGATYAEQEEKNVAGAVGSAVINMGLERLGIRGANNLINIAKNTALDAGMGGVQHLVQSTIGYGQDINTAMHNIDEAMVAAGVQSGTIRGLSKVVEQGFNQASKAEPTNYQDLQQKVQGREDFSRLSGEDVVPLERGQLSGNQRMADWVSKVPLSGQHEFRIAQIDQTAKSAEALASQLAKGLEADMDDIILGVPKHAKELAKAEANRLYGAAIADAQKSTDDLSNAAFFGSMAEALRSKDNKSLGDKWRESQQASRMAKLDVFNPAETRRALGDVMTQLNSEGLLADAKLKRDMSNLTKILNDEATVIDSFERMKTIRERLNAMGSEAFRQGRGNPAYKNIVKALDADMENAVTKLGNPEIANQYKQANAHYRGMMERWGNGAAKRISRKQEGDDLFNMLTSNNIGRRKDNTVEFNKMVKELPPEARSQAQQAIVAKYFNTALEKAMKGVDEPFNLGQYNKFLREQSHVLDILPSKDRKTYEGIIAYLGTLEAAGKEARSKGLGVSDAFAGFTVGTMPILNIVATIGAGRAVGSLLRNQSANSKQLEKLLNKARNTDDSTEATQVAKQITKLVEAMAKAGIQNQEDNLKFGEE